MKVPDHCYDLGVIGQGQIHLISVLWLIMQIRLSFFYQGCSYLAQQLPMVCRLQHRFLIMDMTLKSKVKVKYTKNQCYGL